MTLQVPDFSGVTVLTVGDLMLDQYWFGSTSRISPEAPVPVVNVNEAQFRAGGAANVAVNLASLGVNTVLVGVTGVDSNGVKLRQLLVDQGIQLEVAEVESRPTITKLRVLSRNQQLIRLVTPVAGRSGHTAGGGRSRVPAHDHQVKSTQSQSATDPSRYRRYF
jgi:D-beta-D-heptose 7-phosphate kinase/D-beta-D-heptose 1-phosphate adenosyltransferase